jgi:2-aminoadipate transaminase
VAFVPGTPFYASAPDARSMRLSFVTPSVEEIHRGVAALAAAIKEQQGR